MNTYTAEGAAEYFTGQGSLHAQGGRSVGLQRGGGFLGFVGLGFGHTLKILCLQGPVLYAGTSRNPGACKVTEVAHCHSSHRVVPSQVSEPTKG